MKLTFACPGCGHKISVAAEHAGQRGKCPGCGQVVRIPSQEAQPTAQRSAKAALTAEPRPTGRAPREPAGGLPFDEGEWDQALNPYQSPQQEESKKSLHAPPVAKKSGVTRKSIQWTRRGLVMIYLGLYGLALCGVVLFGMSFFAGKGSGEGSGQAAGLGAMAIVTLVAIGVFGLMTAAGPFLCATVPSATGARGFALAAAAASCVDLATQIPLNLGMVTDVNEAAALAMISAVAGLIAYMAFISFMRKLAMFIGRKDLSDSATALIALGVLSFVMYVLGPVLLFVALTARDMPWLAWVGGGCFLVAVVLALLALGMYAGLVRNLALALPS